jgi:hypothetical protein
VGIVETVSDVYPGAAILRTGLKIPLPGGRALPMVTEGSYGEEASGVKTILESNRMTTLNPSSEQDPGTTLLNVENTTLYVQGLKLQEKELRF